LRGGVKMVDKKRKRAKKEHKAVRKQKAKYVDAEIQCLINNSVP
jgi:hypothetical protein